MGSRREAGEYEVAHSLRRRLLCEESLNMPSTHTHARKATLTNRMRKHFPGCAGYSEVAFPVQNETETSGVEDRPRKASSSVPKAKPPLKCPSFHFG